MKTAAETGGTSLRAKDAEDSCQQQQLGDGRGTASRIFRKEPTLPTP